MRPLPRSGSTGRRMQMSLRYSTRPCALRGALSMLTMPRLAGSPGSSSPIATPSRRSYAPVVPKVAPATNGARDLISIAVIIQKAPSTSEAGQFFFRPGDRLRNRLTGEQFRQHRGLRATTVDLHGDLGRGRRAGDVRARMMRRTDRVVIHRATRRLDLVPDG